MGSRALTPDNQRTWNTSDPPEGNMKFLLLLAFFCSQVRSAPSLKSPRTGLYMADLAAAEPLKIHLLPDTLARSKRSPTPFRSFGRGHGWGRGRGRGRGRGGRGRGFGGNNLGNTITAGAIGFGAGFLGSQLANGIFG